MLKRSVGYSLLLFLLAFSPLPGADLFANPASSKDIILVGHSRHHGDGHHGHGGHHGGGHHGHGGGHHGHGHH